MTFRLVHLAPLLLILAGTAAAEICLVVGVSDGDTLKARCGVSGAFEQVTVRINEIDAPEKGQPYGQASKQALSALCYEAFADIKAAAKDRYGRTVAKVQCRGRDVGTEQVQTGMAWAYRKYLRDPALVEAETIARSQHRGLWADLNPVAPWEWRSDRRRSAQTR